MLQQWKVNHSPSEMSKCEILKNKIKKYINATDYPIKSEVPTGKPARPTQLNMQQIAAAANQLSRTEVSALKLPRPLTLNLRQRAYQQSTGSVSSIGTSPKATPTTPSATHGAES